MTICTTYLAVSYWPSPLSLSEGKVDGVDRQDLSAGVRRSKRLEFDLHVELLIERLCIKGPESHGLYVARHNSRDESV